MAFDQKVSEPKLSKCGRFKVRTVKRGGRLYGHIEAPVVKPGEKLEATYWAKRDDTQRFFKDNSWAIDKVTVAALPMYGVKRVGIRLDDGTLYVTPIDTFGPVGIAKGVVMRNYEGHVGTAPGAKGKSGALQWYVPAELWEVTLPSLEERSATALKKMRVTGR